MDNQGMTAFQINKPLPASFQVPFILRQAGSSGMMRISDSLIVMRLDRVSVTDERDFAGKAEIRVGDFGSFMLVSPKFRGFSFDLLWSPIIAREAEEPLLEVLGEAEHFVLNLILVDQHLTVRGIRCGTIGPKTYQRMMRTQRELLQRGITAARIDHDMQALFGAHPRGIPDTAFQARSTLGA